MIKQQNFRDRPFLNTPYSQHIYLVI